MDLRQLRSLVAIADAGTFVGAAEALRVAQPALSRQINQLERALGTDLFESGARRATLTSAGDAGVRLARHVIRDTERAVNRARLSNSGLAGRCELSSGPLPLISGVVGRLVARVKAKYPGVTLIVNEVFGHKQWAEIAEGRLDIGLGIPPVDQPALAYETQFTNFVDLALFSPTHPLAGKKSVTMAQLAKHGMVGLGTPGSAPDNLRKAFEAELKRHRLRPPPVVTVENMEALFAHVRANHGWTLMVRVMLARAPNLVGVPIKDFRAPFRTVRIWRRADTRPVVRTILTELRQMEMEDRERGGDGASAPDAKTAAPVDGKLPLRLELRHLRSFSRVARAGSLGRAAEALDITQPALSRQMRDLEYDVGVQLLDRNARGIGLTPAGETFLGDVNGVLSVADRLGREVRRAQRGATKDCVLGVVPHPRFDRILALSLEQLAARTVRVNVRVEPVATPYQMQALSRSEVDVAIGHVYPVTMAPGDGLIHHKLVDDAICTALVAIDHPLASVPSILAANLAEFPFLWPGRRFFTRFHDIVMQAFDSVGLRPRIDAEYDGLLTIWSLASQGMGWSLGWESHLTEPPPGTKAVPIRDFRLPWGVELVYRQDESRAPILAVIDAIADAALVLGDSHHDHAGTRLPLDAQKALIP